MNRPYYNVTTKTLVLRVILSVEKHKVFFGVEVLRRRSKTEERSDEGIYSENHLVVLASLRACSG